MDEQSVEAGVFCRRMGLAQLRVRPKHVHQELFHVQYQLQVVDLRDSGNGIVQRVIDPEGGRLNDGLSPVHGGSALAHQVHDCRPHCPGWRVAFAYLARLRGQFLAHVARHRCHCGKEQSDTLGRRDKAKLCQPRVDGILGHDSSGEAETVTGTSAAATPGEVR